MTEPVTTPESDWCPHCPDGHDNPTIKPWFVSVASDRDSDGQPTHLIVCPSDCSHVAESDAAWLWALIRHEQTNPDTLHPDTLYPDTLYRR